MVNNVHVLAQNYDKEALLELFQTFLECRKPHCLKDLTTDFLTCVNEYQRRFMNSVPTTPP